MKLTFNGFPVSALKISLCVYTKKINLFNIGEIVAEYIFTEPRSRTIFLDFR